MVLCINIKNKLSTQRHGEHGEGYGGTPCFLRVLHAGKEAARRPQRRNFVSQRNESPCPPCLRVDLRGMVLCLNIKNKLSTQRHGEHGEGHGGTPCFDLSPQGRGERNGGTPCFLRVLHAGKEAAQRPQRRSFVSQRNESPCPPCLRVDNLYFMSGHETVPR
jgi:hypothetical protein